MFYKIAQKVTRYLGYFGMKMCDLKLSNIALNLVTLTAVAVWLNWQSGRFRQTEVESRHRAILNRTFIFLSNVLKRQT